ncbi:MAG: AMP-binding protein [Dermatophilaceae bacterium]
MTTGAYRKTYDASVRDPEAFWGEAAKDIDWITPPTKVLDDSNAPFYRWFPDATLNTCFNALDRHVAERRRPGGDPLRLARHRHETLLHVCRGAGASAAARRCARRALVSSRATGLSCYMPMVPEAVFAMLACARIGAVHSVVFGGFAPAELAARIDDAQPKVILSASCGIEPSRVVPYKPFLDEAIDRSEHKPEVVVMLQREQCEASLREGDVDWREFVSSAAAEAGADCVEVAATDPLYILYTSGTTGRPKGIYRDNGGHAVALPVVDAQHLRRRTRPDDVHRERRRLGRRPLLHRLRARCSTGATTIVYEGKPVGTPDAGAFWRIVSEYQAVTMFTAPTAIRAIKTRRPRGCAHRRLRPVALRHPLSSQVSGSTPTPTTGLTTSSASRSSTTGGRPRPAGPSPPTRKSLEDLPIKPGSPSVRVPGYQVAGPRRGRRQGRSRHRRRDLHQAPAPSRHLPDALTTTTSASSPATWRHTPATT